MINEINKLEEFQDFTKADYARMSREELGAILGYWDVGDGGSRVITRGYTATDMEESIR